MKRGTCKCESGAANQRCFMKELTRMPFCSSLHRVPHSRWESSGQQAAYPIECGVVTMCHLRNPRPDIWCATALRQSDSVTHTNVAQFAMREGINAKHAELIIKLIHAYQDIFSKA